MNQREHYEQDLIRRQAEHLKQVSDGQDLNWRPCLHDQCPDCVGTGVKRDGKPCVHGISCPCQKCYPSC